MNIKQLMVTFFIALLVGGEMGSQKVKRLY